MKIFLVGGGTGGPTAPLFAVAEALLQRKPKTEFVLIGTKKGLEAKFMNSTGIEMTYFTIPAGKWRRYLALSNIFDIFKIVAGFLKSLYLIRKYQPDLVFGAGSYVQVPMAWAAFLMHIPVIIHQQDRRLLLSTRLSSPAAKAITISFAENKDIPSFSGLFFKIRKSKIFLTGNPVRRELLKGSALEAREIFQLNDKYPTVLVIGGGRGSAKLNQVALASLPELVKYVQMIHVTGGQIPRRRLPKSPNYHGYDFLGPELKHAYAVADLVICRGGMSTISELCLLSKPAIIVPLPKSPQEDNVALLSYLKCAVGVFEEFLNPDLLVGLTRKILWSKEIQETLKNNIAKIMPHDADEKIAELIIKTARSERRNDK